MSTPPTSGESDFELDPRALFAEFLLRKAQGENVTFKELCRTNPTLEADLQEIRRQASILADEPDVSLTRGNVARRLEERYGTVVDPSIALRDAQDPPSADLSGSELKRLAAHSPSETRYTLRGEVARGGMGVILKVWDEDLRRHVAMKFALGNEDGEGGQTPQLDASLLHRFLEEAQITGQLDHPGVVPVHELGLDSQGRVFFTMRLVKGRDLKAIYELVLKKKEGWTLTRAFEVIIKVCDTLAYAHSKSVIHRDLKPANIMVGKYGEVYVMDWGLARVLGREDSHAVRLRRATITTLSRVRTDRAEKVAQTPDSPLLTLDGAVVGTPAYMSPEQAEGHIEKIDPRSDVYAVGAMLYQLLTGRMPYVEPGEKASPYAVLNRVLNESPIAVHELDPQVPAELSAICEKAMARSRQQRYSGTKGMAEDLRAYLEGRVVQAYRTGALAELRKWVIRNKYLAAAITLAVLTLVIGLIVSTSFYIQVRDERDSKELAQHRAEQERLEALRARDEAVRQENIARTMAYAGRVAAAHGALRIQRVDLALQHLDECPEVRRGWEWDHIRSRLDRSVATFRAPNSPTTRVWSLACSPDGTTLATHDDNGIIRLWDVREGLVLDSLPSLGLRGYSLAFDPGGRYLLVGAHHGNARLWDLKANRQALEMDVHGRSTRAVAVSPQGEYCALTFSEGMAEIWNLTVRQRIAILGGHAGACWWADFSPDGERVLTTAKDNKLRIWNVRTGELVQELQVFPEDQQSIHRWVARFGPNGKYIALGSHDGMLRVLDATELKTLRILNTHRALVWSLAFDPSGRWLASGSWDHTVRVWDVVTGAEVFVGRGHRARVNDVAWHPRESIVYSSSEDGAVKVWRPFRGDEIDALRHPADLFAMNFHPDGNLLVTCGKGEEIILWDITTGDVVRRFPSVRDWGCSVHFSPDGSLIAAGFANGQVRLWDTSSGAVIGTRRLHRRDVISVDFSPDGRLLATASLDRTIRLNALPGLGEVALSGDLESPVWCVRFSPDGSTLVSSDEAGMVRIWNVRDWQLERSVPAHEQKVRRVIFSRDGTLVATCSNDTTIKLWDSRTWEPVHTLTGHSDVVQDASFSPDGERLATAGCDMSIKIWNVEAGVNVVTLLQHAGWISQLEFNPDGRLLASVSEDRDLILWDSQVSQRNLGVLPRARERVRPWIEKLHKRHRLTGKILTEIAERADLTPAERRAAANLAHLVGDHPFELNARARAVVQAAGKSPLAYVRALRQAVLCCEEEPENSDLLHTLGLAHYRLAQHGEALVAFERADEFNRTQQRHARALDLLWIAICDHQLGETQRAQERLNEMRAQLTGEQPPDIRACLREAIVTIEGK